MTTTSIKPKDRVRFTDKAVQAASHLKMMLGKAKTNDFLVLEVIDRPSSGSNMPTAVLEMPMIHAGRDAFCVSLLEVI